MIYSQHEEINSIYTLHQGRVKVGFFHEKNVEVVVEILKEDDVFGNLNLGEKENSNFEFAQVLSGEALICGFRTEDFKKYLLKNGILAAQYGFKIADKLKIVNRKYADLVFKDVRARVLNFLLLHAQYEGKWTGNTVEINMFCTQQDIANFAAASRQTVSMIIQGLVKDRKIIFKGRSKLTIPDVTILNQ